MFCRPCIIVYQYDEANVMHCSFDFVRNKGLYMFRVLLTHPQEALHNRHLVYCVYVVSWLRKVWSGTEWNCLN
jgi:hypothetical protein